MKILEFDLDKKLVIQNQQELSDMIRVAFYKENPSLFQKLTYENDNIFLEPTLFHYFSIDKGYINRVSLEQATYGYLQKELIVSPIGLYSDRFGMVNLPNIGYLKIEPNTKVILNNIENDNAFISHDGHTFIKYPIIKNNFIKQTRIRLCFHPTDLLTERFNTSFVESVQDTALKFQNVIDNSFDIFHDISSDFIEMIKLTSRELVVFNSASQYSLAALTYYGVGFLNVVDLNRTEVFFVDDIAHQCGHVLYHALTLHSENYLRISKETPLKEFTNISGESRTVYGTFHGLFTYTTIIYILDKCLDNHIFKNIEKHEAIGRLGFYMEKFQKDLVHMNDNRILTSQGFEFYEMFLNGYNNIKKKYSSVLPSLDYSNQPYLFSYDLFQTKNQNSLSVI